MGSVRTVDVLLSREEIANYSSIGVSSRLAHSPIEPS